MSAPLLRFAFCLFAACLAAAEPTPTPPPRPFTFAFDNVSIIDVVRGQVVGPRTVRIADGRITAIEASSSRSDAPPDPLRIDGTGCFLIPGLVDLHVHLFNHATRRPANDWTFPLFVANGVTAVREMSTQPEGLAIVRQWRERQADGQLIAPRIVATSGVVRADSPEAARLEVRRMQAAGLDFIKVFSQYREPIWRAIVDEARTLRMPTAGHTPYGFGAVETARNGQRSSEHLTQIFEGCVAHQAALLEERGGLVGEKLVAVLQRQEMPMMAAFDPKVAAQLASDLAKTGQVQVPTLVLMAREARGPASEWNADARWRLLRVDEQARWDRILREPLPPGEAELAQRRWETARRVVPILHAGGVRVLAGTDAPMPLVYPGYSLHDELALLVECGLSPADALRAATLWPAEFLGLRAQYGSVEVGLRADLVLLKANPLTDIQHTRRIHGVMLEGRWLDRTALDGLLK